MWHSTMVDHDWFLYSDNLCHNATLDNDWPWLTMVDLHIETIFVIIWCWTMVNHGSPWLWQCDIGARDNLCHNVTMVDHGWDNHCHNVTLDHGCPWFIFILRSYLSQCDDAQWLTMVDFYIETIFATMWHWTIANHGWPRLIFVLRQSLSQCDIGLDDDWLWLTVIINLRDLYKNLELIL